MNTAEKAVATSRPLDEGAWSNSHRIAGDLIAWLAETLPQRDVVVIGSGSLVSALQQRDLVDEYRLIAFPTALAAGRRLFPDAVELDLVWSEQVGPGSLTVHTTRGPVS
jgi:dihydrofolate reductase